MPNYIYLRSLWWEEGNIHPEAKWEEAILPYVLVEGVTLEEYERRTDIFNVRGLWEWTKNKVLVYELPEMPHETCICAIVKELNNCWSLVDHTDATILGLGSTQTRADNCGKGPDASFRPVKSQVQAPNGSDGQNFPWPNLIIEVAYLESTMHVLNEVKNYWLKDLSRVHDAIVVKIDPISEGEMPSRMQAWHFCASDRITRKGDLPARTHFEFGTHDQFGNVLNSTPGTCIIRIELDCLYHQVYSGTQIPRGILPDPIELDLSYVRDKILFAHET
ncbi:hypothetical protein Glove_856g42 [Diversispora epigaea]|uniref:Restriction endonuclease domain-containing protein n=1 Tax=Diversispora epigaea TaxID=1348612 RepID=A0A397FYE7_9GLOM|nr:hypothetical protein Glove_856g42 [Diversispora epigaea]